MLHRFCKTTRRRDYSTGDKPDGLKCVDNLLPTRLTLHQVIKGSFNVIQSTFKLLNHVRFQTPFDQAREFLPQELG